MIDDIGAVPLEVGVPFVLQHKGYVCRNVLRGLVPFFGESDLGPFLPALLNDNVEDLVLRPHAPSIRVQPASRNLHALSATMEDLLQGDLQLMDHGGVLVFPAGPQALRWLASPPAALARETVVGGEAELPAEVGEGVVLLHVHILLRVMLAVEGEAVGAAVAAVGAEEHVEGVGAAKKGGERGVRVSMEGVVVRRVSWSPGRTATACLQTCE